MAPDPGTRLMTDVTLDELGSKIGQDLGASAWYAMEQDVIDTFARITHDDQWIHVDRERAADGPFGAPIAHGFLTLSMCAVFVYECLTVREVSMSLNYGLERVRFPAPVPAGACIRGVARLVAFDERPDGAQAVIRITVETDAGSKPACVADLVTRYQR
jgi:acyl dehydratase